MIVGVLLMSVSLEKGVDLTKEREVTLMKKNIIIEDHLIQGDFLIKFLQVENYLSPISMEK